MWWINLELEMLSVENKLPTFNNLMSKEILHMYIFVHVTLDLEQVILAKCKENQTLSLQLMTFATFGFLLPWPRT